MADDVLARRAAGLDGGLGVTDLFQAVVDLRDRGPEAPFAMARSWRAKTPAGRSAA
nr:hypothetical protein [Streptomyces sp. TSRI0281]